MIKELVIIVIHNWYHEGNAPGFKSIIKEFKDLKEAEKYYFKMEKINNTGYTHTTISIHEKERKEETNE